MAKSLMANKKCLVLISEDHYRHKKLVNFIIGNKLRNKMNSNRAFTLSKSNGRLETGVEEGCKY